MEQDVTVKIPRTWIKGLPEEELTLKQILRLGISNTVDKLNYIDYK